MEIRVTKLSVAMGDPDVFTRLSMIVDKDITTSQLAGLVAPFGRMDDDGLHAYLSVGAIGGLPGARPEDLQWQASFDQMCAYAVSKGWSDDAGAIRAHIEKV